MRAHSHARASLTLVIGGSFTDESDIGQVPGRPLDLVFRRAGHEHATRCSSRGLRTMVLELDTHIEGRLRDACIDSNCGTTQASRDVAIGAMRLWSAVSDHPERAAALLDGWLAALAQHKRNLTIRVNRNSLPAEVTRALALIDHGAPSMAVASTVADALGMHPSTLTRLFQRTLGTGVMEQVRRARLRRAAGQLADPRVPLAAIAASAGFSDQSHMCRDFTRELGMTPGQFRRLASTN